MDVFYLKAAGVTKGNRQNVLRNLRIGEQLYLRLEPDNPYDCHAVHIYTRDNQSVGYIPKESNTKIFDFINSGEGYYEVKVRNVTGGGYGYAYGLNMEFRIVRNQRPYNNYINQNIEEPQEQKPDPKKIENLKKEFDILSRKNNEDKQKRQKPDPQKLENLKKEFDNLRKDSIDLKREQKPKKGTLQKEILEYLDDEGLNCCFDLQTQIQVYKFAGNLTKQFIIYNYLPEEIKYDLENSRILKRNYKYDKCFYKLLDVVRKCNNGVPIELVKEFANLFIATQEYQIAIIVLMEAMEVEYDMFNQVRELNIGCPAPCSQLLSILIPAIENYVNKDEFGFLKWVTNLCGDCNTNYKIKVNKKKLDEEAKNASIILSNNFNRINPILKDMFGKEN